jgi:hypothetical protein
MPVGAGWHSGYGSPAVDGERERAMAVLVEVVLRHRGHGVGPVMELGGSGQWSSARKHLGNRGEESWEGISAGNGGGGVAPLLYGQDGERRPVGVVMEFQGAGGECPLMTSVFGEGAVRFWERKGGGTLIQFPVQRRVAGTAFGGGRPSG